MPNIIFVTNPTIVIVKFCYFGEIFSLKFYFCLIWLIKIKKLCRFHCKMLIIIVFCLYMEIWFLTNFIMYDFEGICQYSAKYKHADNNPLVFLCLLEPLLVTCIISCVKHSQDIILVFQFWNFFSLQYGK